MDQQSEYVTELDIACQRAVPRPERLLTMEEVADWLAISVRKGWRMLANGELPGAVSIGKRGTRFRRSDIARYIDQLQYTSRRADLAKDLCGGARQGS